MRGWILQFSGRGKLAEKDPEQFVEGPLLAHIIFAFFWKTYDMRKGLFSEAPEWFICFLIKSNVMLNYHKKCSYVILSYNLVKYL